MYFDTTRAPFGSWAEYASVPEAACLPVAEGIDDATVAALGNTGLAAWTALQWRAGLQPDETVLVLGATGSLGRIAVQAAKALGAGRVVAADLDSDRLRALTTQGADAVVAIDGRDDLAERLRDAAEGGADVTIDPLWGAPALAAMQAAAPHGARHIQLGTAAGERLEFTATALRSHMIDLRGFAVFRCPIDVRRHAFRALTRHVANGDIAVDLEIVPLSDVATAWHRQLTGAGTKLVLDPTTAPTLRNPERDRTRRRIGEARHTGARRRDHRHGDPPAVTRRRETDADTKARTIDRAEAERHDDGRSTDNRDARRTVAAQGRSREGDAASIRPRRKNSAGFNDRAVFRPLRSPMPLTEVGIVAGLIHRADISP